MEKFSRVTKGMVEYNVFVAYNHKWTPAFGGDDAKFKRAFTRGWTPKKYSSSYKRMAVLIELEGKAYQMADIGIISGNLVHALAMLS